MPALAKRLGSPTLQASTSEVLPFTHSPRVTWATWIPSACAPATRRASDAPKRCSSTNDIRVKVVRVVNTSGPRTHHAGRREFNVLVQALSGEPITLSGTGEQTRSFRHFDELAKGLLRLMATPDAVTGPTKLGNPNEFTMRELADRVLAVTGARNEIVNQPLPQADPRQRQPDIAEAKRVLDWQPTVELAGG